MFLSNTSSFLKLKNILYQKTPDDALRELPLYLVER